MSAEPLDPVENILLHARRLQGRPNRVEGFRSILTRHAHGYERGERILQAWSMEDAAFSEESDPFEPNATQEPTLDQRLKSFIGQAKRPSVQASALAAIWCFGPMSPAEIIEKMVEHGFPSSDGLPDQTRAALWHARKNPKIGLVSVNSKQAFASADIRRGWGERNGIAAMAAGGHMM
jgi:hypothetical protein